MKKKNEILPGTKEMTIYKRTKKEIFLDFFLFYIVFGYNYGKRKQNIKGKDMTQKRKKKTNISSIYACKYKIGMK